MNIVLFCLFVSILFYDVRKGIIIYAPFKLFFIPGYILIGKTEFDVAFSIIAFVAYLGVYGLDKRMKVPWLIGLLVGMIAYICNSLYPLFHPLIALHETFSVYLYAIIYFASIQTKIHVELAIKSVVLLCILLIGNGIIEYLSGMNILGDFQKIYLGKGVFISKKDIVRLGIHTTRSFIPHAIGFGVVCACLFFFFLIYSKTKKRIGLFNFSLLAMTLVGVIISGSRTPLLGLGIMILPILINDSFLTLRNVFVFLILIVSIYIFSGLYAYDMVMTLFDDSNNMVGGSSFEMRKTQFDYSIYYWLQKPVWGWGASAQVLEFGDKSEILGGESVWFTLMMKRGIVGMASYIFLYLSIFWSVRHLKIRKIIFVFMIGWLAIATGTNLPGINFFFPLMITTIFYKLRREISEGFNKRAEKIVTKC